MALVERRNDRTDHLSIFDYITHCIYKSENDRLSLGVRCARWSPTEQVIVVGDYEECITIFSYLTYKKIQTPFEHPQELVSETDNTILKEEEYNSDN
ncbi:unnamed protein product [Rotaria sp. Silwood1]|nr:unnamed protein product [Rotaria sp. Silwood1]CAF1649554.1 unnamed protein product [Rotaria sp. Silwood1]CAF4744260.1 unnamed protein product [Rotaria sp. Silwood1]